MSDLRLSIVIVNSDGLDDTINCIASIERHPPSAAWELIVVDNRSREPCLPLIGQRFPWVRCLAAPARQGFARNYNLGIHAARGAYVLVLNNDTLVPAGSIDQMLATMNAHPEYGMLGPRVLLTSGATQTECHRPLPTPHGYLLDCLLLDPGLPLGALRQRWRSQRAALLPAGIAPCIVGACMLVRASDIAALGALDERYTFYYEDIEWCHRFWHAGRAVGYDPAATITHLHDRSARRVKVWAKQHEYHGALRYFDHYYGVDQRLNRWLRRATLWQFLQRGILMLLLEAVTGRAAHARDYLYLVAWLLGQSERRTEETT